MNIDFSLVLVVLTAIAGFVWLLDVLVFARPRRLWAEKSFLVEYAKSFFPILLAVLLLRSFLFEPFQIPSGSMLPTLNVGDFIVVNKFAYGLRLPIIGTKILSVGEPQRGDVMVFIPPHDPRYFIKRVIGLPGDYIQYRDNVVYVNGEPLLQESLEGARERGVKLSKRLLAVSRTRSIRCLTALQSCLRLAAAGRRDDPRRSVLHDGRQPGWQYRQPRVGSCVRDPDCWQSCCCVDAQR